MVPTEVEAVPTEVVEVVPVPTEVEVVPVLTEVVVALAEAEAVVVVATTLDREAEEVGVEGDSVAQSSSRKTSRHGSPIT